MYKHFHACIVLVNHYYYFLFLFLCPLHVHLDDLSEDTRWKPLKMISQARISLTSKEIMRRGSSQLSSLLCPGLGLTFCAGGCRRQIPGALSHRSNWYTYVALCHQLNTLILFVENSGCLWLSWLTEQLEFILLAQPCSLLLNYPIWLIFSYKIHHRLILLLCYYPLGQYLSDITLAQAV